MKPQIEGRVWQVLGLLVVIAAAMEICSATQQFTRTLTQSRYVGSMDLVWPYAMGVFAGFLFLAGASAMISGRLLRVIRRHTPQLDLEASWPVLLPHGYRSDRGKDDGCRAVPWGAHR